MKPERIWLKDHPEVDERWLQDRIGEDPALLGLGDLVLKDKERPQPRAGASRPASPRRRNEQAVRGRSPARKDRRGAHHSHYRVLGY